MESTFETIVEVKLLESCLIKVIIGHAGEDHAGVLGEELEMHAEPLVRSSCTIVLFYLVLNVAVVVNILMPNNNRYRPQSCP